MKGVTDMKKIFLPIILALCALILVGCKRLELPVAGTIEITEYSTTGAGEIRKVTVRDAEQVKYISQNLNSLTLKKMGYNKPTMKQFSLVFYNRAGMKIDTLSITAHGWIDYGGDFHFVKKGELDLDYIKALLTVTAQNKNEKYSYSSVIVSSGGEGIQPIQTLAYTNEYSNDGESLLCGDGLGYYGIFSDPETKLSELPVLVADGKITVTAPKHSRVGGARVFDSNFEHFEDHSGFDGLHLLPAGDYVIVFFENTDSRKTNPNAETYWLTQYEHIFRLTVPEREIGEEYHSLVFVDASEVMPEFDLNAKYRAGERVKIPLYAVTEQYYRVFVDGEQIQAIKNEGDNYYTTFAFIMPDTDAEIRIEVVPVEIPSGD